MPTLTLAHSPDPDDAFMWWPITGKLANRARVEQPDPRAHLDQGLDATPPVLKTGRWIFRAVPADIEALNRLAAAPAGDSTVKYDITALSFRAYCDVRAEYAITRTGSSFGEGFGPKVVAPERSSRVSDVASLRNSDVRIAIPGRRTTAFLVLGMALGVDAVKARPARFVEMPFDQIIGAVATGEVDAGLVIHEGQLLFKDAGLRLVVDVGAWWHQHTGLPLPLGCNALRRDIDTRFGPGSIAEVSALLRASVDHALANRAESLEYALGFALANAARPGSENSGTPTLERVDRYVGMYVNDWTVDMGQAGLDAVRKVLEAGYRAGLCPDPGLIDAV
jgi:1,4-dihydroxy-6-naphthoate synthase